MKEKKLPPMSLWVCVAVHQERRQTEPTQITGRAEEGGEEGREEGALILTALPHGVLPSGHSILELDPWHIESRFEPTLLSIYEPYFCTSEEGLGLKEVEGIAWSHLVRDKVKEQTWVPVSNCKSLQPCTWLCWGHCLLWPPL